VLRIPLPTPFRVRNFRLQCPADLLTSSAFEMETLILSWYVLSETGSVMLLTVFAALQFGGTLISPMLGVIGDRVGQRNLLCSMRAIYTTLATVLLVLAFSGRLNPALVLVIGGLTGLVRPSDLGMRLALVAGSMPADQLTPAMGIARTTSDLARVAAPLAGAAAFAAFGIGPAYVLVVGCYSCGLIMTLAIAPPPVGAAPQSHATLSRPSAWKDLKEGIAYACSTPQLLAALLIAFLVNLTAYPLTGGLLPYVAKEVYGIDQTGLGYLVASFGIGSLIGSLVMSTRGARMRPMRLMINATLAWYAMLLVLAQMWNPWAGMAMLMLAGIAQSVSMVTMAVVLLRTTSDRLRGRIMGVRMMVIYGLPLGLLMAGVLIERAGFQLTATLYAIVGLIVTALIGARWHAVVWRPETPANAP
jgi:predicted MFS family arabinose efflux permease